jgi:hypothetical protein
MLPASSAIEARGPPLRVDPAVSLRMGADQSANTASILVCNVCALNGLTM